MKRKYITEDGKICAYCVKFKMCDPPSEVGREITGVCLERNETQIRDGCCYRWANRLPHGVTIEDLAAAYKANPRPAPVPVPTAPPRVSLPVLNQGGVTVTKLAYIEPEWARTYDGGVWRGSAKRRGKASRKGKRS